VTAAPAIAAVAFDVGETLVDETRSWEAAADRAGVPRLTLLAALGGLIARGEPHDRVWALVGAARPRELPAPGADALYPDVLPALRALRAAGVRLAAAGNMPAAFEAVVRERVDVVGSSARWGVAKPDPAFFARLAAELGLPPAQVAYVGDRVDNDVRGARAAGMRAVHLRRGPWALLHPDDGAADVVVDSLLQLVGALGLDPPREFRNP
jgi:HAD superfamily hydrolase (TIGR01509 family)